ncbi:hypothetical protein GCM10023212_03870 [Luteolibacter yonseiensis]
MKELRSVKEQTEEAVGKLKTIVCRAGRSGGTRPPLRPAPWDNPGHRVSSPWEWDDCGDPENLKAIPVHADRPFTLVRFSRTTSAARADTFRRSGSHRHRWLLPFSDSL